MIPYGRQHIDENDIDAVIKVLKSDWLTQGPKVLEFEKRMAEYCGAKYAVAVANGTCALHLAYLAAGIKEGDEIITTPNTFAATTNMLLVCGAKPVFCDIRLDTYNIDEEKIEELITPNTRAIVPVHFAGHPCEMDKIYDIARKYNLLVIEDACHAMGAEYKNKKIGSLSDMTIFSFHPVKTITTGEGGAIITNNGEYYKKILLLRNHGIQKNQMGFSIMTNLGYNYRMTDIQAALGISQLSKLDEFIGARAQIANSYFNQIKNIKEIFLPTSKDDIRSSWHLFVIRVKKEIKKSMFERLRKANIYVQIHYIPVYHHPHYQSSGYNEIKLANTEYYYKTCISLPIYPNLSKKQIDYILEKIKLSLV